MEQRNLNASYIKKELLAENSIHKKKKKRIAVLCWKMSWTHKKIFTNKKYVDL